MMDIETPTAGKLFFFFMLFLHGSTLILITPYNLRLEIYIHAKKNYRRPARREREREREREIAMS